MKPPPNRSLGSQPPLMLPPYRTQARPVAPYVPPPPPATVPQIRTPTPPPPRRPSVTQYVNAPWNQSQVDTANDPPTPMMVP
eukprot:2884241-Amphidinium_carterae.1